MFGGFERVCRAIMQLYFYCCVEMAILPFNSIVMRGDENAYLIKAYCVIDMYLNLLETN